MGLLWSIDDTERRQGRPQTAGLALVTVLLVSLGTLLPRQPTLAQVASAPSVLRASTLRGELVRLRCGMLEARVDGARWAVLDRARRQGLVLALAWECFGRRGVDAITVVDAVTGRTVATSADGDTWLAD
jgi:hypothetical protein